MLRWSNLRHSIYCIVNVLQFFQGVLNVDCNGLPITWITAFPHSAFVAVNQFVQFDQCHFKITRDGCVFFFNDTNVFCKWLRFEKIPQRDIISPVASATAILNLYSQFCHSLCKSVRSLCLFPSIEQQSFCVLCSIMRVRLKKNYNQFPMPIGIIPRKWVTFLFFKQVKHIAHTHINKFYKVSMYSSQVFPCSSGSLNLQVSLSQSIPMPSLRKKLENNLVMGSLTKSHRLSSTV